MPNLIRVEYKGQAFNVPETADRAFIADLFGIPRADLIGLQVAEDTVIPFVEGKSLTEGTLALIAGRTVTCRLAQAVGPDWSRARKLYLGGGTGGLSGEYVYNPAPGIKVASSAPVYNSQNFFYMRYLFEGEPTGTAHTDYWITKSSGPQTLRISFERPLHICLIRVCATAHPTAPYDKDRRSNYRIVITSLLGGARNLTHGDGFVDTADDEFGSFHTHVAKEQNVIEILFRLTQEKSYGVCLKKIEIWSVE
jgi:hypothetical protein